MPGSFRESKSPPATRRHRPLSVLAPTGQLHNMNQLRHQLSSHACFENLPPIPTSGWQLQNPQGAFVLVHIWFRPRVLITDLLLKCLWWRSYKSALAGEDAEGWLKAIDSEKHTLAEYDMTPSNFYLRKRSLKVPM